MFQSISVRTLLLLCTLVYLVFIGFLYMRLGITTTLEAAKYITAAEKLINGNWEYLLMHLTFFSSYVLFITPLLMIASPELVVWVQIILNIVAAYCLYRLTISFTQRHLLGVAAFLAFLLSPTIQRWTLTLYTDNFFTCLVVFLLYWTLKEWTSKTHFVTWFSLAVLTVFGRPPGVFIVIPALFYKLHQHHSVALLKGWRFPLAFIIVVLAAYTAFFLYPVPCGYLQPIAEAGVTAGIPVLSAKEFNPPVCNLYYAYLYIIEKKGEEYIPGLMLKKAVSLFVLTREHHSTWHNALSASYYVLYPFFLVGLFYSLRGNGGRNVTTAIVILYVATIAITHNEWHGRFSAPLLPLIILLAMVGVNKAIKSIMKTAG